MWSQAKRRAWPSVNTIHSRTPATLQLGLASDARNVRTLYIFELPASFLPWLVARGAALLLSTVVLSELRWSRDCGTLDVSPIVSAIRLRNASSLQLVFSSGRF